MRREIGSFPCGMLIDHPLHLIREDSVILGQSREQPAFDLSVTFR
jgi:hypothetical protein